MAYNNKKGNKKKQNNNGYFQQNIQRDGEDFLRKKNADDIQRDSKRIIKDLVYNPDDIKKYAQFFMDRNFLMNLYAASEAEMMKRWCVLIGLTTYQQMAIQQRQPIDPRCNIDRNIVEARQSYEVYFVIVQQLNNIISYIDSGYDQTWQYTNILNCLQAMASSISRNKRLI